ncbi:unnamed protein product [Aphis gossypii]|uniref:BTB domain-containing protein n=1 Tax=Aphis gossypii TaxID=80765 RepID=A0A9P0NIN1_APHGO|nr:unnamed protein product [Aphis gossypii]
MNYDNLSPSSSQNQVQRSREQFPTRYYFTFEVLVVCDVKLTTDDGAVIYARKNDLVNASDYFNAMFNKFNENYKDHIVILKELDSFAFKLIIDFIYSGLIDVTEIDLEV